MTDIQNIAQAAMTLHGLKVFPGTSRKKNVKDNVTGNHLNFLVIKQT